MKGINNGKGTTLGRQFRVVRKGNVFLLDEYEWLTRLSCSWMMAVGGLILQDFPVCEIFCIFAF
jgi:hypothetical protein